MSQVADPTNSSARLLVVEDDDTIRDTVAEALEMEGFAVTAATNGRSAWDLLSRETYDLVVLDLMLPGINGTELMRRLSKSLKNTRVLVFSGYQTPALVREMLQAGAHGFVEKTAPLQELKAGIEAVAAGGTYFGPEVAKIVRDNVMRPKNAEPGPTLEDLTPREMEILKMVAQSYTTKDVAARLNVSVKTAENHRTNLMRKLKLHNAAALTRFAVEQGIVDPNTPHADKKE